DKLVNLKFSYYGLQEDETKIFHSRAIFDPVSNYLKNNLLVKRKKLTLLQNVFKNIFVNCEIPKYVFHSSSLEFCEKSCLLYSNLSIYKLFSLNYREFVDLVFDKDSLDDRYFLIINTYSSFYAMIKILYSISFSENYLSY